jgi:hypothetical protein
MYWAGDANFLSFGKWWVGWNQDGNYFRARGFLVQKMDSASAHGKKDQKKGASGVAGSLLDAEVGSMTEGSELHGLMIQAHGTTATVAGGIAYSDIAGALKYKLGLAIINACDSQDGATSLAATPNGIAKGHTGWHDPSGGWAWVKGLAPGTPLIHPQDVLRPGDQATK